MSAGETKAVLSAIGQQVCQSELPCRPKCVCRGIVRLDGGFKGQGGEEGVIPLAQGP